MVPIPTMGMNLAPPEQQGMGVYDVREEHEPNLDDFEDQDQEQFEDQTLMSIPF